MARLVRGLMALSCVGVLALGLNLVVALGPNSAAGLQTGAPSAARVDALPQSALVLGNVVNGAVLNRFPQVGVDNDGITDMTNAIVRDAPDAGSNNFLYIPASAPPTLPSGGQRPGDNQGGPPNRPTGPDHPPRPPTGQLHNPAPHNPVSTLPGATTTGQVTTTTTQPTTTTILTTTTRPSPATTVPSAPTGVIPVTIPHPGINGDNGYIIGLHAKDPERSYWRAPYLYEVPYIADAGWLAGDRVGYGCAYGFLHHQGEIIGRFTFRKVDAAGYVVINDSYMAEGERYYDGSSTGGIQQVPDFECPVTDQSYEVANAPDEDPLIVFWSSAGQAVELRDYRGVVPGPGVTFQLMEVISQPFQVTSAASGTHTVNSRVTVLARENGVPVVVVYYDALGRGSVTENS